MATSHVTADGLDLARPDEITDAELGAFRAYYEQTKKAQNASYDFWLEFRPSVVKRHKARTATYYLGPPSALSALTALHQYVCSAFADGIEYEIELAASMGASRGDVLDVLSIAFIHSGHPGMYALSAHTELLRRPWPPSDRRPFPEGWNGDRELLVSGMDFTELAATPEDCAALIAWYERTIGEVPRWVTFLARRRPDLLKTYRNRYEHAIAESLPVQMLPYLLLNYSVSHASADGIRENLLLGRALGLTRAQALDAICSAVLHAGAEAFALVDELADPLLDTFPES
jgi:hypothetical protein